jgi:hypothetical protein
MRDLPSGTVTNLGVRLPSEPELRQHLLEFLHRPRPVFKLREKFFHPYYAIPQCFADEPHDRAIPCSEATSCKYSQVPLHLPSIADDCAPDRLRQRTPKFVEKNDVGEQERHRPRWQSRVRPTFAPE